VRLNGARAQPPRLILIEPAVEIGPEEPQLFNAFWHSRKSVSTEQGVQPRVVVVRGQPLILIAGDP
jgi:hypothetical protein